MKIWLLRHGRTHFNDERRYQGQMDIPLSEAGAAELYAAQRQPETVYVSPLCRARQTALRIFPDARQIVVEDFREMDFGVFDGRTADEMAHDTAYRAWVDGGCVEACPSGERRADFCARTCGAFVPLVEEAAHSGTEWLVIVAHGGTQRALMEHFALPERDYYAWMTGNGRGYALDWDETLWREKRRIRFAQELCFVRGAYVC